MGTVADSELSRTTAMDAAQDGAASFDANRTKPNLETKLENGATVYGDEPTVKALAEAVNKHPRVWTEKNASVQIPLECQMTLPLKDGWKRDTKLSTKVYPIADKIGELKLLSVCICLYLYFHGLKRHSFETGTSFSVLIVYIFFLLEL